MRAWQNPGCPPAWPVTSFISHVDRLTFKFDINIDVFFLASQLSLLIHTPMLHSRLAHAVSCGRILRNASLRPVRRSWMIRPSVSTYNARTFSSNQVLRNEETDKLLSEFKENCKARKFRIGNSELTVSSSPLPFSDLQTRGCSHQRSRRRCCTTRLSRYSATSW
jgi:hypothetical protein